MYSRPSPVLNAAAKSYMGRGRFQSARDQRTRSNVSHTCAVGAGGPMEVTPPASSRCCGPPFSGVVSMVPIRRAGRNASTVWRTHEPPPSLLAHTSVSHAAGASKSALCAAYCDDAPPISTSRPVRCPR